MEIMKKNSSYHIVAFGSVVTVTERKQKQLIKHNEQTTALTAHKIRAVMSSFEQSSKKVKHLTISILLRLDLYTVGTNFGDPH